VRQLSQHILFAIRQFRKAPGFALTAILTIAIGIGATTAIFSLINTVLLRPLPFSQPDRLMSVLSRNDRFQRVGSEGGNAMSYPDFFDWRAQNKSFSGLAAYHGASFALTGSRESRHLEGQVVASDFFRTLGVSPMLGRDFNTDDEKPRVSSAMLSYDLWTTAFGSAPDIVGRSINLDGTSYTVVGVMPKGFEFPIVTPAAQLWTSIGNDAYASDNEPITSERGAHFLDVVGRLKPGATRSQAEADLAVIAGSLAKQHPDTNRHFTGAVVTSQLDSMVGDSRTALRLLFAAVSLVLLIACANVAGLLLARSSRRRTEIAIRGALGANRRQIAGQVLVESLFLALCGGALGVVFSVLLLRTLIKLVPSDLPRLSQVSVDGQVLLFATVVSVVTGLLFGVLPALRISKVDPSLALRDSSRTATVGRSQHRVQNSLVVVQTAIGLVLLIGSGLLIRSFVHVLQVDPGFDRRNVLNAYISLPDNLYSNAQKVQFYERLLSGIRAIPGVRAAGAATPIPLSGNSMRIAFDIEGHPLPEGERNSARVFIVTPGYFETMRIPVLRGRGFQDSDQTTSTPVAVVSESFVRKYFPDVDPIGRHINPGLSDGTVKEVPREIVGIVGDVKAARLTEELTPSYYLPLSQAAIMSPKLVVRTEVDPVSIIGPLRAQVAALNKEVPVYGVKTFDDLVSQAVSQPRFQAVLLSIFAGIALLLTAVGLYGLLSYLVAQRTLEIGVRIALGAQRSSVLRMFLHRGLMLAAIGVAVGIAVSMFLATLIGGMLFGIRPLDPMTFAMVSGVPLLVALIASGIPAYRAARLDPMKTLRDQ
jgi:predicted permease